MPSHVRKIWLSRHGESEFNRMGLIGGNSELSTDGEEYARRLPAALLERLPRVCFACSALLWCFAVQTGGFLCMQTEVLFL
jgi:broad specificity phosphatase PhoE